MPSFIRTTAHWVGRHAFPALAATVIAVGAAGGGIGYAVASQHSSAPATAALTPATSTAPATTAPKTKTKTPAARAAALIQRALAMLASQTGQTVASVRSQLEAGKSIDDIAGAKAPAIENEILAAITKLAGRAVAAGRISSSQETADLAIAKTKIEALMAEPGTQLIKDAQQALQFLQMHGHRAAGAAGATPSPAA